MEDGLRLWSVERGEQARFMVRRPTEAEEAEKAERQHLRQSFSTNLATKRRATFLLEQYFEGGTRRVRRPKEADDQSLALTQSQV